MQGKQIGNRADDSNKRPEEPMALSRREADMMDRYIQATLAARAALEPHPSWESEKLRAKALLAIRAACGGSPGMDDFYGLAERTLGIQSI